MCQEIYAQNLKVTDDMIESVSLALLCYVSDDVSLVDAADAASTALVNHLLDRKHAQESEKPLS